MVYELRIYRAMPGRMQKLLARFNDHVLPIWAKYGITQVGFWRTHIGQSNNDLTYMLVWESLADRESKWMAFQKDPAWLKAWEDSEKDGPTVANISCELLTPTSFQH